ncbi:MAG: VWA domain-containing protein [Anaerolineales bacterium]|nr:VWA domain-containing protein [Anaerolineales bacterium]
MHSFFTTMAKAGRAVQESNRRRRRGCWLRFAGCIGFLGLLLVLFVLLAFALARKAGALEAVPSTETLAVQLVIDNSNSMFDKDGVGTDPELLRMAAARLFIEYLGVDDTRFHPSCGLIFFGTESYAMSPLMSLAETSQRATLAELLTDPERLGWTDHLKALEMARRSLVGVEGRKAIILLTDGKPEWKKQPVLVEQAAYRDEMAALGRQLADEGVALFIILLAGPHTADAEIATVWQPMWQDMAAATGEGRFLIAQDATDMPGVYHDIVVALAGRQSAGAVIDDIVSPAGLRQTVPVEPALARLILVVRKSYPSTTVTIYRPDGAAATRAADGQGLVAVSGEPLEEIWTFANPEPGDWVVAADGEGRLTVWKDFEVATPTPEPPTPAPAPTATIPATPMATATSAATATATPMPVPTATIAPVSPAGPVKSDRSDGRLVPLLLGIVAVLAAGAAGYIAMRRRNRLPVLSGTLHVYEATGETQTSKSFDLYTMGRTAVILGAGESDIRLPSLPSPLVLRVQPNPVGGPEIVISANPDVTIDGRRLVADQPVYDGDVFVAGGLRLRYENLQRRRPRNRPAVQPTRRGITPSVSK